jgi:hypothetical protein
MSQSYFTQYNSFFAYTLSDTNLVSCRAITVNASGTVVFNAGTGGADVTVQVNQGQHFPILLNQGLIKTGGTATGITVWN